MGLCGVSATPANWIKLYVRTSAPNSLCFYETHLVFLSISLLGTIGHATELAWQILCWGSNSWYHTTCQSKKGRFCDHLLCAGLTQSNWAIPAANLITLVGFEWRPTHLSHEIRAYESHYCVPTNTTSQTDYSVECRFRRPVKDSAMRRIVSDPLRPAQHDWGHYRSTISIGVPTFVLLSLLFIRTKDNHLDFLIDVVWGVNGCPFAL